VGPHFANFRTITEDLRAHEAIRISSKENLAADLVDLLCDPATAGEMGERAKSVFDQQAGATARTIQALQELLVKQGSLE
jgi:3-deoxy-D-manno-octulosonic-acid transferase